jgi:hypothetical protein
VNELADEDLGVVDQRVDTPEPVERLLHHALGGVCVGDVTIHGEDVGVAGGRDRPRGGDDGVPGAVEGRRDARPDALRGAGDDRDLLGVAGTRCHPTR